MEIRNQEKIDELRRVLKAEGEYLDFLTKEYRKRSDQQNFVLSDARAELHIELQKPEKNSKII